MSKREQRPGCQSRPPQRPFQEWNTWPVPQECVSGSSTTTAVPRMEHMASATKAGVARHAPMSHRHWLVYDSICASFVFFLPQPGVILKHHKGRSATGTHGRCHHTRSPAPHWNKVMSTLVVAGWPGRHPECDIEPFRSLEHLAL